MPDFQSSLYGGDTANTIAEQLRPRLRELHGLFPSDTIAGDPARFDRFASATVRVGELTAELAVIARTVPGYAGRLIASVAAGVEKDPDTGKILPVPGTVTNMLPSPIGLMDPTAVGEEHNFYLPAGVTNYIPRELFRFIPGGRQQGAEDLLARNQRLNDTQQAELARARQFVALENDATLEAVLARNFHFGDRAGVLNARFGSSQDVLRFTIENELATRRNQLPSGRPIATPVPIGTLNPAQLERAAAIVRELEAAGALTAQQQAILAQLRQIQFGLANPLNPFGTPPAPGAIPVGLVPALTGQAIANQRAARGINAELVTERVDP